MRLTLLAGLFTGPTIVCLLRGPSFLGAASMSRVSTVVAGLVVAAWSLLALAAFVAARRVLARAASILFVVVQAAVFFSCMSWLTRFRSGFFINYGLLRFFLGDPIHVLALLTSGDRQSLLAAVVVSGLLVGAAFGLTAGREDRPFAPPLLASVAVVTAALILGAGLGVYPARLSAPGEADDYGKQLCYHSTPGLALLCSALKPALAPGVLAHGRPALARIGEAPTPIVHPDLNIVLIVVESLRRDSLTALGAAQPLMPNLDRLAAEGLLFANAYSQSNATDYSVPALLSSLYPLRVTDHDFHKDIRYPKTLVYDVLKPLGYRTAIFSSNNDRWGNTDAFLKSSYLDEYFYSETYPGKTLIPKEDMGFFDAITKGVLRKGNLDDRVTVEHFLHWARQGASGRPFFAYLNFQSTHFPYQQAFEMETPFEPNRIDFEVSYLDYPLAKRPFMLNRYWNSLRYVDGRIHDVVEGVRAIGRGERTLFVIVGDHGESFLEHGKVTHGSSTYDEEVRVPLILHGPMVRKGVEGRPVQHVDVVPTLLGLLGVPIHPNFQGIDVLAPGRDPREHRLFLTTQHGVYQDVLVWRGLKYVLNHQGADLMFDLASDPGERVSVLGAHPVEATECRTLLLDFREAQLAYYSTPETYLLFYPPRHE